MERKTIICMALIFLLIFAITLINAKEQKFNKTDKKVIEEINKEGKTKVIVVLKDTQTNNKRKTLEIRASQRDKIKDKIDIAKIKHDFSSANAFSASLSAEEIEILSQ